MLSYLRIRGLALLDDVTLELGAGLTVLTGETGAGKSIIVDAVTLLRGGASRAGPARAEWVRAGADAASVEAAFEPSGRAAARVAAVLESHALPQGDEPLVVRRVVPRTGRGRIVVQGQLTPQSVLAQLGAELLDVCSQHEHHSLTQPSTHVELLDAYAHLDADVAEYTEAWRAWQRARDQVSALRARAADGARQADFLRFQVQELQRAQLRPGEREELGERVALLRGAEHWASFARAVEETVYEADDAICTRLAALRELGRRAGSGSSLGAEIAEQLDAALIACQEAARLGARLGAALEYEPGALERAEDRLHELDHLARKHGVAVDELPQRLSALSAEADTFENFDQHLCALEATERETHERARKLALVLSERRRAAAARLARALSAELEALHMPAAKLEARLSPLPAGELSPRGCDRVELSFSANAGEPLAPLDRVASGGELSRVLLALKSVLAAGDAVSTYVFDEVDAGVGGAVAEAIGRRLARAAQRHQVLCITHLPQIAAFADTHLYVEKRTEGGRTTTRVRRLSDEQSIEELARMLGGARVTDSARRHARELVADARAARASAARAQGSDSAPAAAERSGAEALPPRAPRVAAARREKRRERRAAI